MKRSNVLIVAGVLAAFVVGMVSPAAAADDLVIPVDSVVRGTPLSTKTVATVEVPADLVGDPCEVTLLGANNDSVHEGNHLIVSTGDESVTFPNVESESFQETTAAGEVVMGETVVVQLQFGEDGVSSGGLTLSFDCSEEVTTTVESATTIAPTTTEVPVEVLPETAVQQPAAAAGRSAAGAQLAITG